ncbi:BQ5605_C001g00550 [Microbotryum silenes-dioicae]|uniref:5'-3' exoribonuclease 1 n=1 Tax=Microbotryum silenes-dioicae TaxID=796604 RepID=A0A2X0M3P3_9BASI|nr:BQ5605_C001g00550 [Microbotryum silenes-dioicae]
MGIPKFFRFMSERYPLISQLIQDDRIPEFDALYLDMNGIIHNCSHPNDNDASFRISDEQIFLATFAYISHLFSVIKPRKLFFLAVDGVAPRAKMNQQRSRRFRTAKEMKELVDKAKDKGEEMPEGDGFDSNCITPGTPFMARLSEQLKYFIAKKVSEDADWRGVEIILSGHEVPGEGEHKIMEYIRLNKAQPGYDSNVRHCMYGLDADLIMLGLLSHDPHFCLLREEVTFGPKKGKAKGLEVQKFFLMYLSLFREYLDLEFQALKTSSALPFEYDLERIIDDFILLNIFVGNDFLPHLPGLHINEGALGRLFEIYKRILPTAGGYLNEHGNLNVKRLQLVLDELTVFEQEHFEYDFADSSLFKAKPSRAIERSGKQANGKLVITKSQQAIFTRIQKFLNDNMPELSPNARLELPGPLPSRDQHFLATLAEKLQLSVAYDEFDEDDNPIVVLSFEESLLESARNDSEGQHWQLTIGRVLSKYESAETPRQLTEEEQEDEHKVEVQQKMLDWKKDYYKEKLEFDASDPSQVDQLAYRYIEGLQWVLRYYYSGVASWGWFYNYHYAPKISDLNKAYTYEFNFELGKPFKPFEQLMGVLPDLSSQHIPLAFRDLLSDPTSPILDFYPVNFEQDLNGKKQDWEAIVKIPFIDEKRLLATMATREPRLTNEERKRNSFGDSWRFNYDQKRDAVYASSLPGFFPDLYNCHTVVEPYHLPTLDGSLKLLPGLVPGVLLGKDAISGFPSLHTIPFTGRLDFHGVSIFQRESQKETMVVQIDNLYDGIKSEDIAALLVGKRIYVGYPYLQEALVVAISDELFRYDIDGQVDEGRGGRTRVRLSPQPNSMDWKRKAQNIEHTLSKKQGLLIGHVDHLVHVKTLRGLKQMEDGAQVKEWDDEEQHFALQATVAEVSNEDVRYVESPAIPVDVEFPEGAKVFFFGAPAYGAPAQVVGHDGDALAIRVAFFPTDKLENRVFRTRLEAFGTADYVPAHAVARRLRISGLTLSKITSSVLITHNDNKLNIGLNLKFEAKSQKVLGYSRKGDSSWEFTNKAIELIIDYCRSFPEIIEAMDTRGKNGKIKHLSRSTDFFAPNAADQRVKDLSAWLKQKGVKDLERVALWSDQLDKTAVQMVEQLADRLGSQKHGGNIKQAVIKGIPRHGLLKPAHALTRLRDQHFSLGDRVAVVSESGSVPLSAKGTVVGIQTGSIDVVFDVQFLGGSTLGGRCSDYRGATVGPATVLNLTDMQFVHSNAPPAPATQANGHGHGTNGAVRGGGRGGHAAPRGNANAHFTKGPRGGPTILPAQGLPAGGFHPAPNANRAGDRPNGIATNGHQVTVLKKAAPAFDPNAYGEVARGVHKPSSNAAQLLTAPGQNGQANKQARLGSLLGIRPNQPIPQQQQQHQLGSLLGIPVHAAAPIAQQFNGRGGRGGGGYVMPARRGLPGQNLHGAVPNGSGVNIPPPAALVAASNRGRGRGGRGAPVRGAGYRGGRGGAHYGTANGGPSTSGVAATTQ